MVRGEGGEGSTHLEPPLAQVGLLDDTLRYIFAIDVLGVQGALRPLPEALLPADRVHGPVVDEGEEEGPEGPPGGVVGLGRPPEREERVLDHLLGEELLAGHPEGQAVGRGSVAAEQLVERRDVPPAEAAMQLEIVREIVRHGLLLFYRTGMATRGILKNLTAGGG